MAARGMSFDDLAAAFRQRKFDPLYLFYGEEDFLMDELQALLIKNALQPHERDFNFDRFFGPEADVKQVLSACASYPMMAERRVVVVTSFDQLADNRDFTRYASQLNPTAVVLLLCRGKVNLSTHPYRALKAHGTAVEFSPPRDKEMPTWLARRAKTLGLDVRPPAAQMLADEVGTDLRVAAGELEKLKTYLGERTTVTEDDVLAVAGQLREYNIFELQRALGQNDRARAMSIVSRMLDQASNRTGEAIRIVTTLSWYLQKLRHLADIQSLRPSDSEVARHIGVRPYFVGEYRSAVRQLGPAGIRRALRALLVADYELKAGSNRDPRLVVQLMVGRWTAPIRRSGTVVE
jgi:DNA polymerase III subunit delta